MDAAQAPNVEQHRSDTEHLQARKIAKLLAQIGGMAGAMSDMEIMIEDQRALIGELMRRPAADVAPVTVTAELTEPEPVDAEPDAPVDELEPVALAEV